MSKLEGELGILARRRIEAEIIKPIYEILNERWPIADFAAAVAQQRAKRQA